MIKGPTDMDQEKEAEINKRNFNLMNTVSMCQLLPDKTNKEKFAKCSEIKDNDDGLIAYTNLD